MIILFIKLPVVKLPCTNLLREDLLSFWPKTLWLVKMTKNARIDINETVQKHLLVQGFHTLEKISLMHIDNSTICFKISMISVQIMLKNLNLHLETKIILKLVKMKLRLLHFNLHVKLTLCKNKLWKSCERQGMSTERVKQMCNHFIKIILKKYEKNRNLRILISMQYFERL